MERHTVIVAGFGFRSGATVASLHSALDRAGLGHAVTDLATPRDKAEAPCFLQLATRTGLPVHAVTAAQLQAVTTRTLSHHSQTHRGTGSVAEAAALAAAGAGARLLAPRSISDDHRATCALAIKDPS